ncbi:AlpA family transcriptional regulator [Oceanobacter sp. 4_MG-2023]|uniref:helix-turn-helix transcriptional regulator n=1 Tax=Oceanobacter sp. 4_MG-2023 TaxID=3062623 RepID=UPI002734D446|nr:helix-turn-helix domain-containing protein [Oceanobacter sp. 4_MG-2023]MDP2548875.1 helix-turn-helix domain-containing protein [Oceanobacter sp. 4_MG-2023]
MTTPASTLLAAPKLNATDAARAAGVSPSTWRRAVESGCAPQPIHVLGQRRWLESDIESWIIQQNPHLADALELRRQAEAVIKKSKFRSGLRAVGGAA